MKMNRFVVAAMTTVLALGATAPAFAAGDRDGHPPWPPRLGRPWQGS